MSILAFLRNRRRIPEHHLTTDDAMLAAMIAISAPKLEVDHAKLPDDDAEAANAYLRALNSKLEYAILTLDQTLTLLRAKVRT